MNKTKQKNEKETRWLHRKENWWIGIGFIIASSAISLPFILMWVFKKDFALDNFEALGVVGDFFGGTTVGLLSLASIIFVTAAIIMQKEELGLQRDEVKKAREEYEVTNATMKKQQFDSTFFNMINLHHNITKNIEIGEIRGRAALEEILKKIKFTYNSDIYSSYVQTLKKEAISGDKALLDELIKNEFFNSYKATFIQKNLDEFSYPFIEEDEEPDTSIEDNFFKSLEMGTNIEWNDREVELKKIYKDEVYMKDGSYETWLDDLNFMSSCEMYSCHYMTKFNKEFNQEPLKELKVAAFKKVYDAYESQLGHYFRNLYHIVKLIQDEKFSEDHQENRREQQKYRGILRAQLSSFELLLVFYNLVYSEKGEKFKSILKNTCFFDDHLSNFIWPNDFLELREIDAGKNYSEIPS
ncbi:putative phage abortive infection protein [Paenibacillus sp. p3-SID867]|uniref:putative phage abortive infection protein n=1 Tax=Paenibacillus sp. p3-SID867 TaxID=2916363 RepID=UPI0021A96931|nr:putative phage abortive infection protein [Paenibacillus sp. p3-SID867]MCT1402500.1 putative phage abortive infection protein [Paenibacillus sp. p3-SID867]